MKKTLNQILLFMIILCAFIAGALFLEATKGAKLDTAMVVAIITLIACWPTSYWLMYHKGRYDERNRYRARITNLMESYQTEPHGIRFSQKAR
jgi:hypothetical protein